MSKMKDYALEIAELLLSGLSEEEVMQQTGCSERDILTVRDLFGI